MKENENLNGKVESQTEQQPETDETTTIVVNGEAQEVQMAVTGEPAAQNSLDDEIKKDFENDELFVEMQEQKEQKTEESSNKNKFPEVPVSSMVMFSLSVGWLIIQWLLALISGF